MIRFYRSGCFISRGTVYTVSNWCCDNFCGDIIGRGILSRLLEVAQLWPKTIMKQKKQKSSILLYIYQYMHIYNIYNYIYIYVVACWKKMCYTDIHHTPWWSWVPLRGSSRRMKVCMAKPHEPNVERWVFLQNLHCLGRLHVWTLVGVCGWYVCIDVHMQMLCVHGNAALWMHPQARLSNSLTCVRPARVAMWPYR